MSNYLKTTDFATKDGLLTGNPLKIISGTEINDEYNAIQVAVNSKANSNSPSLTGVPLAPTAAALTSTTQIANTSFVTQSNGVVTTAYEAADDAITLAYEAADTALAATFETLYPVGSIYTNTAVATNPATLLGFGTWVAFGAGRVLVGIDAGQTEFDTLGETGGANTHTLTVDEIPAHTHTAENQTGASYGQPAGQINNSSGETASTGGGLEHNNLQPYIVVYMWNRTA